MAVIESARDLHLIKKALAIAVQAMGRCDGPLSSPSDQHDMKLLLDRLATEGELEFYSRAAWIELRGDVPPSEQR